MTTDFPTYTVCVTAQQAGLRVDKFLSDAFPDLTRTRIQQLMSEGCVTRDGEVLTSASSKVKVDMVFEITIPPAIEAIPQAQDIPLNIVYEDADLLVVNKPAGMVVHPAPGNPDRTLVNALLAHCGESLSGINGVKRPGIVHRLDKGTSGLLVVAKNDKAHQSLASQLSDRSMSRVYQALVWGAPPQRSGTIEGNIGRSPQNRKKMTIVARGGKEARTHYQVIESFGMVASLVQCKLDTGRTHQIRVHLTSKGMPLIGDPLYGKRPSKCPPDVLAFLGSEGWHPDRVALHAETQTFIHPTTGERCTFQAPLPGDIRALMDVLRFLHQ